MKMSDYSEDSKYRCDCGQIFNGRKNAYNHIKEGYGLDLRGLQKEIVRKFLEEMYVL
jgi:hypothetical protein